MKKKDIEKFAHDIRLLTIDISYRGKVGHVGSALSIVDIVSVLYATNMHITPRTINDLYRDRFILSKGHAAACYYAALYKKGLMSKKTLYTFAMDTGGLCEHPEITTSGVDMTTGSLGHGIAFGAGIALGMKKLQVSRVKHHVSKKTPFVYVLISDGECGEGSVWEAVTFASRMKLDNLVILIDYNHWQCFGPSDEITHLNPFIDKWKAFGWAVSDVDGHNLQQLADVYTKLPLQEGKPSCIICHTVSGKGVSCMENTLDAHYKILTKQEYIQAKKELLINRQI